MERLRHRGCNNSLKVAQLGNGDRGLELRQSDFRDPVLNHYAGSSDYNYRNLSKTVTLARNTDFEFWLHLFAPV